MKAYAWHVHHDALLELLTEPLEVRAAYIRDYKPSNEHGLRLRLLHPVIGPLSAPVVAALAESARLGAETDRLRAESERLWAESAGVPVPPDTYDAIQPPALDPDVNISAPALYEEVQGKVKISGTAAGADFASFRLLVGKGLNPQEWIEIAESSTSVSDGLLAEWDTQGLSGLYAVQLVVTRTDQRVDTAVIQVTIASGQ